MTASLGKYVSSLLPSFEKSQIDEDIRILKEDLTENTLPPFEQARTHFSDEGYRAKATKDYDTLFRRRVTVERPLQGHYIHTVYLALRQATDNLSYVEARVDKLFSRDVTADGMTYARANVLRFIEVLGFATRYSRKLLAWTYHQEQAHLGRGLDNPLSPAEETWMRENQQHFFRAVSIIARKGSDLEAALKNIPDMVIVPKEADVAETVVGSGRLDPLAMGLIPIRLNPIYHIRMAVAEYQVHRYKVAKEEKRALEYRLLALKEAQADRADANLEKQISYTENRVKKLNFRLAKMEEE